VVVGVAVIATSAAANDGVVHLTTDAVDESAGGLAAYKIQTPVATYYLEKSGAGLSSLVDRDGNNWLGFHPRPGSRAAGEYRGFPNAVHQQSGSYFHPRNAGTDPAVTRVESSSPDRVSIVAESDKGHWACRYDFFPTRCDFTMTRMPPERKFWVLYEGTPAGKLDSTNWWMTSAIAERQPISKRHDGDIPAPEWIAFGDQRLERAIVLVQHADDSSPDTFYAMDNQMTVFGFGRQGLNKFLDKVPARFSMLLVDSTRHDVLAERVKELVGGARE
jgi:hypothetical protein